MTRDKQLEIAVQALRDIARGGIDFPSVDDATVGELRATAGDALRKMGRKP